MAAKDLGAKHTCFKCGVKFYDLKKPEPVCPKCGSDQRESPALRAPERERRRARPAPAPVIEEEAVEEEVAGDEEEAEELEADQDEDL